VAGESDTDPVARFKTLPTRLYLDTSVVSRMSRYSGEVFEGEPLVLSPRAARDSRLPRDIEALRRILIVNQRAMFEFVITEASLQEVDAKRDPRFMQWVRDVEETWLIQSERERPPVTDRPRIGSVSVKDWALIADALTHRCDAFLTMDGPLESQAPVILRRIGLRVMRPATYWMLLEPWTNLWQ
jgi:hypothetical protein